jgi:hypothetical protein
MESNRPTSILDFWNEPVLNSCDLSGNLLSANLFVDNGHGATLF